MKHIIAGVVPFRGLLGFQHILGRLLKHFLVAGGGGGGVVESEVSSLDELGFLREGGSFGLHTTLDTPLP